MKKIILLFTLFSISVLSAQNKPEYIRLNPDKLQKNKAVLAAGNPAMVQAYEALIVSADRELNAGPYSVTYKTALPPSGDKHDYMSMGPYWWPDPTKPDGLPYIRRDGEINPERAKYTDRENLGNLLNAVSVLGSAYYFSGDEKYAEHAAKLLRVFFIDPETRMNPNLRFGQAIPGICDGRGIGIIETAGLAQMMEGITLMSGSKAWTREDDRELKKWLTDYQSWLENHPYGIEERGWHNNHGTYYDVQLLAIMLFTGQLQQAREHIEQYTFGRFESQIRPDGSQPHELERTKAWGYSTGNLNGLISLAEIAEKVDIDLWHYQKGGQVYLKSAIDWYLPYLRDGKQWDYEQIVPDRVTVMIPVLRIAAEKYNDSSYTDVIPKLRTIHPNITYSAEGRGNGYRLLLEP